MTRTEADLYTALDLDARARQRISLRVTPGRRLDVWPALALATIVAVLVTAAGLGTGIQWPAGSPLPPESAGVPESPRPAPPVVIPTMAYVVSPGIRTDDAPVYLRRPGVPDDIRVADGVVVSGAGPDVLVVVRRDGHAQAVRVSDSANVFSDRALRSGRTDALVVGDTLYEYSYDELVAITARGDVRSLSVPSAAPTTVGPCELQKGGFDLRASGLRALASANGHLYAYVATLGNGALVNLDDGRRLDLIDAGAALAMVAGSDGKLYVLTIDGRCASNHLILRRIDPTTMRQEAAIDLGHGLPVARIALVATVGGTYIHEVTDTSAQLLRVESAGVTTYALPPDSGLFDAAAPDGTIYLFGGRARNLVTRFDPGSGTTVSLDTAKAPEGSFVTALFFVR